ncbi:SAM-dependent methyltransferase [Ostreibacterium oceani]|uniref:Methyltransferase domain-containing protein n=1 Tax=Ostreibacterium oceani TaxID=2654998 RepID=A0A6N7EVF9_9GAMM|nr:cyclopropane-fatty-acyl-phospholipid synthase family protein [Ostreibacterium oceani]MPV86754.1 methyltransferase domain-containing protein [Ostreibacterium oceani]
MDKTTQLLLRALENTVYGQCEVILDTGQSYAFAGKYPGPAASIRIHHPQMLRQVAIGGDIAFADAYRLGHWDSEDIAGLVEFVLCNEHALQPFIFGQRLRQWLSQLLYVFRRNTRAGSRKNIHAHYDLGNDFYALWLDATMSYSSAWYRHGNEDLFTAQQHKYDRILAQFDTQPQQLLEIGCGWGGFAERCLTQTNHHVKGITISTQQHDYAVQRLQPFGDAATVVLEDYRDQRGKYDGLVSIEMFEAVGERYWKTYFAQVNALLQKKGTAVIQTITIDDDHFANYRKSGDAIRSFIFPGGMLPSPSRLKQLAQAANLQITDTFYFGQDYAKTLLDWLARFDRQVDLIASQHLDPGFARLWRFYLAYCAGAFNAGRTNVVQLTLRHA